MKGVILSMRRIMFFLISLLLGLILFSPNTSAQGEDVYTVKWGDTLWKISKTYKVGLSEIINANPQFEDPDLIYPGDKVTIPLKTEVKSIESEVVRYTNQYRQNNGLSSVTIDWQLSRVARYKSRDMRDKGYFSHNSPTYGSPFKMMRDFNISYTRASENIAAGQNSARSVVRSWMNSSGHRKNILDPNVTHIGVGYAEGGSYSTYWTQMFIKK